MHISSCICPPFGWVNTQNTGPLDVRVSFRPHRTLKQSLMRLKDCTPPKKKAGVVYRIRCGTCGRAYIDRLAGYSTNGWNNTKSPDIWKPSIISYSRACHGRDVSDWKEAQVVDSHPHYTKQCTLEAWHIRLKRNNLNIDVGPLPSSYNPVFILFNPPQSLLP